MLFGDACNRGTEHCYCRRAAEGRERCNKGLSPVTRHVNKNVSKSARITGGTEPYYNAYGVITRTRPRSYTLTRNKAALRQPYL